MIELFSTNLPILVGFLFVLGLLTGSFLNVVIYRLPIMLNREWQGMAKEILEDAKYQVVSTDDVKLIKGNFNLSSPRSACPKCNNKITSMQNIPVISWLLLKGKCANCKTSISARYPLVELLTAFVFSICAYKFGFNWSLAFAVLFSCILIAGSFIDYDTKLLPDQLTLPLVWFGITAALIPAFEVSLQDAVLGAITGYMVLWSIYWLFKIATGKEGMGHGDFKLLAAIGAFVGIFQLPLVILLSTVSGAIIGIFTMIMSKKGRDYKIPFGPFLAIAGWIALIWGETITSSYLNLF